MTAREEIKALREEIAELRSELDRVRAEGVTHVHNHYAAPALPASPPHCPYCYLPYTQCRGHNICTSVVSSFGNAQISYLTRGWL